MKSTGKQWNESSKSSQEPISIHKFLEKWVAPRRVGRIFLARKTGLQDNPVTTSTCYVIGAIFPQHNIVNPSGNPPRTLETGGIVAEQLRDREYSGFTTIQERRGSWAAKRGSRGRWHLVAAARPPPPLSGRQLSSGFRLALSHICSATRRRT